jgi:hypothetical protein
VLKEILKEDLKNMKRDLRRRNLDLALGNLKDWFILK